jgi:hypothetical protein
MKKYSLYKVKPNKLEDWKVWCVQLETEYKTVVLDTLKEENVKNEVCVLFEAAGEYFVLGTVSGDDLKSSDKTRELNQLHIAKRQECLEKLSNGEILFDFET